MMIHELTAKTGGHKRSQRKGRGESSGRGKTCGRGTKGSGAHGGDRAWVPGHEGGQTKHFRRFPKRGFSNDDFERKYHIVNLSDLERFTDGATVDAAALIEAGLVPDETRAVKILGAGEISRKLTVVAGWFSKSAHEKITRAGGTARNLKGEPFVFPKEKSRFVPREDAKKGGKKKAEGTVAEPKAEQAEPRADEPTPGTPA